MPYTTLENMSDNIVVAQQGFIFFKVFNLAFQSIEAWLIYTLCRYHESLLYDCRISDFVFVHPGDHQGLLCAQWPLQRESLEATKEKKKLSFYLSPRI